MSDRDRAQVGELRDGQPGDALERRAHVERCRRDGAQLREESRQRFRDVMADLKAQGAQAIILGCTEISLLVGAEDSDLPLYDTTAIHARAAADAALARD